MQKSEYEELEKDNENVSPEEVDENIETDDQEEMLEEVESSSDFENNPYDDNVYRNRSLENAFSKTNGDKNYYRNKKDEAEDNLEKARRNREKAQAEKDRDYKKTDPNDETPFKSDKSDVTSKNKQDRKKDKKALKKANQDFKNAEKELKSIKRDSRLNKLYQIAHPLKATKSHIKNQAKKVAVEKVASILKNKHVLIALIVFFLFFLLIILIAIIVNEELSDLDTYGNGYTATTCQYDLNGINEKTKIELINCEATKDNYTVLETINFEKYVAGVAIAEMGPDYVDEAMKAQIIAVRSYTLTRNIDKYGVGYDSSNNVIRMRACENDQVYWDYEKDIYRDGEAVNANVSKYSPEYNPGEGEIPWKKALSEEAKAKYEKLVSTVMGEYVVDASGNIVHTPYIDKTTQQFTNLANANAGTVSGEYTAILMSVYPEISKIEKSDCITPTYAIAGNYANWKQECDLGGNDWCNVRLGSNSETTIDEIGCYITSTAILIAHSGVPTSIENFNPGTFAEALKSVKSPPSFGPTGLWQNKDNTKLFVPSYISMSGNKALTGTKQDKINTLRKEAEAGEFIILVKKNDAHFMAMDNTGSAATGWTTIKVWDPADNETDLFKTYDPSDITNYRILKLGGTT